MLGSGCIVSTEDCDVALDAMCGGWNLPTFFTANGSARDHGLPVRLLDWTRNPLVALYLAVFNNRGSRGAVYSESFTKHIDIDAEAKTIHSHAFNPPET